MRQIILASQSPRRRELMELIGFPFSVRVSETEELITRHDPAAVTEELSWQKAQAVAAELDDVQEIIVIGADTVVSVEGQILGKPGTKDEARSMIRTLQGRDHMVYTGVTILGRSAVHGDRCETFSEGTRVTVASMDDSEIESYISTEEPYDKAGAYGIQGTFARFIQGISGDYYNVMGLPVHRLYEQLKTW
jgi:MAF protein